MRDRLIELIDCSGRNYDDYVDEQHKTGMSPHEDFDSWLADDLLANGVTVQEMDGCAYCKEDADGYRLAFGAFSLRNPFHNGEWEIRTGHCNPRRIYFCPMCGRRLPQPPKGE